MDFGRVPEPALSSVDFSLPAEPTFNQQVFTGKPVQLPRVYVGCAKWGRREWVGKIYPPGTKEKDFLQQYVRQYNSIELNATHYKLYGEDSIARWAARAGGQDFIFCPKMYRGVTHRGHLNGKDFLTSEFLRGIMAFGEHLGPVFIQLGETFPPSRKQELFDYLSVLPADLSFFLEVRHPDWFAKEYERAELFTFLARHKIGAVITDTAGRRDCAHMHLTVPRAFIRYVGNSLHATDFTRCDAWVQRMQYWLEQGLEELYFFMHMHDEATSPELTVYLVDKLNAALHLNLVKPVFINSGRACGAQ